MVAALHVFFLVLEMFLWDQAAGPEDLPQLQSRRQGDSRVLAANQGLYNGFLAAGLVWGLFHSIRPSPSRSRYSFCSA